MAINAAATWILQGWVNWCRQSSAMPPQFFWSACFFWNALFSPNMLDGHGCHRYFCKAVSVAAKDIFERHINQPLQVSSQVFWNVIFLFWNTCFFPECPLSSPNATRCSIDASVASPAGRLFTSWCWWEGWLDFGCEVQQSTCVMPVHCCQLLPVCHQLLMWLFLLPVNCCDLATSCWCCFCYCCMMIVAASVAKPYTFTVCVTAGWLPPFWLLPVNCCWLFATSSFCSGFGNCWLIDCCHPHCHQILLLYCHVPTGD